MPGFNPKARDGLLREVTDLATRGYRMLFALNVWAETRRDLVDPSYHAACGVIQDFSSTRNGIGPIYVDIAFPGAGQVQGTRVALAMRLLGEGDLGGARNVVAGGHERIERFVLEYPEVDWEMVGVVAQEAKVVVAAREAVPDLAPWLS